jgi:hypothetical protein
VHDPRGSVERIHDDRDRVHPVPAGKLDPPPVDSRRQAPGTRW